MAAVCFAPESIAEFLDVPHQLIRLWPTKKQREQKASLLAWIATHFLLGHEYVEADVNTILLGLLSNEPTDKVKENIDHISLRRELCECSLVERRDSGDDRGVIYTRTVLLTPTAINKAF
ncbi:hypothetical protein Pelo_3286 [Pelomyxa schiedti]|nr:hypothetical protein Pelo_3286 [Pelomyxa schiedti]